MSKQLTFLLPKKNNYNVSELLLAFNTLVGIDSTRVQRADEEHWFIVMSINPRATLQDIFNAGVTASKMLVSGLYEC